MPYSYCYLSIYKNSLFVYFLLTLLFVFTRDHHNSTYLCIYGQSFTADAKPKGFVSPRKIG